MISTNILPADLKSLSAQQTSKSGTASKQGGSLFTQLMSLLSGSAQESTLQGVIVNENGKNAKSPDQTNPKLTGTSANEKKEEEKVQSDQTSLQIAQTILANFILPDSKSEAMKKSGDAASAIQSDPKTMESVQTKSVSLAGLSAFVSGNIPLTVLSSQEQQSNNAQAMPETDYHSKNGGADIAGLTPLQNETVQRFNLADNNSKASINSITGQTQLNPIQMSAGTATVQPENSTVTDVVVPSQDKPVQNETPKENNLVFLQGSTPVVGNINKNQLNTMQMLTNSEIRLKSSSENSGDFISAQSKPVQNTNPTEEKTTYSFINDLSDSQKVSADAAGAQNSFSDALDITKIGNSYAGSVNETIIQNELKQGNEQKPADLSKENPIRAFDKLSKVNGAEPKAAHVKQSTGVKEDSNQKETGMTSNGTSNQTVSFAGETKRTGADFDNILQKAEIKDASGIVNQTAQAVEQAVKSGRKQMQVHLSPETLGGITIKMISQNGALSIQITADNPETGKLLAGNMNDLNSSIQQQGIHVDSTEIFHTSSGGYDSTSGSFNQSRNQQQNEKQPVWVPAMDQKTNEEIPENYSGKFKIFA